MYKGNVSKGVYSIEIYNKERYNKGGCLLIFIKYKDWDKNDTKNFSEAR